MYCPKCGSTGIIITSIFKGVRYIVCEKCEEEFSIKYHAKVGQEMLNKLRFNLQRAYENKAKGSLLEDSKIFFEKLNQKV
ncbi:hypothetical protein BX659_13649 [Orenia metallireducens]|uniref:Uncharacterized protein n=1 Tax=Orenia metallireducens TaxID=1413210 RepID=A0A285ID46_9FIRM|nr:hypothetical protein [Orenia metallireducens]PRX20170.1 hypothetical protein BX659_13649 [Orenia metallireducens]SNY45863.1 hypothetical protein SAMN06265827_13949 [Orenia metallireducens]